MPRGRIWCVNSTRQINETSRSRGLRALFILASTVTISIFRQRCRLFVIFAITAIAPTAAAPMTLALPTAAIFRRIKRDLCVTLAIMAAVADNLLTVSGKAYRFVAREHFIAGCLLFYCKLNPSSFQPYFNCATFILYSATRRMSLPILIKNYFKQIYLMPEDRALAADVGDRLSWFKMPLAFHRATVFDCRWRATQ